MSIETPMQRVDRVNAAQRSAFLEAFDSGVTTLKDPDMCRGCWQWADKGKSYNIMASGTACPNDCTYCYVKSMFARFKFETEVCDMEDFAIHEKKWKKGWSKTKKGPFLYMFPSSHDIFDSNVGAYIDVALKMLAVGHNIIVVSKPRLSCVKKLCAAFVKWKKEVVFRFSISSTKDELLEEFEPNAPRFNERLECLKYARKLGYATSVSMEPYISDPIETAEALLPYATKDLWIGLMNYQKGQDNWEKIEYLYEKDYVEEVVEYFKSNEKVYWKESIMKMFVKYTK